MSTYGNPAAAVNPALAAVLARLASVKKSGAGYLARCPAHPDTLASLSIGEGSDGRVLLYCHAGCVIVNITDALGLKLSDLFLRPMGRRRHG
jgi:hypothetical protein